MAGFSNYTGNTAFSVTDSPQAAAPNSSLPFSPASASTTIPIKRSYTLGDDTIGDVDEVSTNVLTIAADGSSTMNLQSLTDMLGVTDVVLVRLKRYVFWILSPQDDATAGTNCTGVTIGAASTDPNNLNLGGTSPTIKLTGNPTDLGDYIAYVSRTAAGLTVSTTALNVLVTNNDASNAAAVYYNLAGCTS